MLIASLLLAPTVMLAATQMERRLGPSAAGWVAALPLAFAVAAPAVALNSGPDVVSAMALSAAEHVPAQISLGR
ncbi:hypothetical protein [Cellulomonas endophytica]|uniref:hypothetical protein n=1 Tax=Cellulomonas endophytica TaxID=2494735 RepID=UPI001011075A|nr:hypothetical protein [Cellulomonas endophytica]